MELFRLEGNRAVSNVGGVRIKILDSVELDDAASRGQMLAAFNTLLALITTLQGQVTALQAQTAAIGTQIYENFTAQEATTTLAHTPLSTKHLLVFMDTGTGFALLENLVDYTIAGAVITYTTPLSVQAVTVYYSY